MSTTDQRPQGGDPAPASLYDRAYPPLLRQSEAACLELRREQAGQPPDPRASAPPSADAVPGPLPADAIGLALSGGGIRSATFSLGVLQALAAARLLRRVDILSTVSGGGYIGAFLGALAQRGGAGRAQRRPGILHAEHALLDPSSTAMRWLRDNGRYMSPNGAGDEITAAAVYLRNLFAIHLVMGTTLLALIAWAAALRQAASLALPGASMLDATPGGLYGVVSAALLLFVCVPLGWSYWLIPHGKALTTSDKVSNRVAPATAIGIGVVGAGFLAFSYGDRRVTASIALVSALAVGFYLIAAARARQQKGVDIDVYMRAKLSQWLSASLLIVTGVVGCALVETAGDLVATWATTFDRSVPLKLGGSIAGVAGLLATVSRVASSIGAKASAARLSVPRALLAGLAASLVIGLTLIAISAGVHASGDPASPNASLAGTTLLAGAATVLTLLFGQTVRFVNNSSHQALYGNRLTRAYLGASNPNRFENVDGQRLSDPIRGDNIGWGSYKPYAHGGPLHIVNTTLNETVLGASQIEQRDRKGLALAVGPCGLSAGLESHALWLPEKETGRSGAARRRWLPGTSSDWIEPLPRSDGGLQLFAGKTTDAHQVEALSLGTWTAISGAAFTTGLGARTSLGLSLLLGLANVRLGYWWDSYINPNERRAHRTPPTLRNRAGEILTAIFPVQAHLLQESTARFFGPHRRRWYLSDGGHFENTACYELLRRRVPYIVCCDNGQDERYAFEDIGNLVRKARIDYCADIRFLTADEIARRVDPSLRGVIGTLDDLRSVPDASGQLLSRAHAALAVVSYENRPDPESVMLFIKPSVTGDEPEDVLQYRRQKPAFPNEPTTDQYFDEAQWESYRALGEHIGRCLFGAPGGKWMGLPGHGSAARQHP